MTQMETGTFNGDHFIVDADSGDRQKIKDHPQLAEYTRIVERKLEAQRRTRAEQVHQHTERRKGLWTIAITAGALLIVAAGLASDWIEGSGVQVSGMPTVHGNLSYLLRRIDSRTLRFTIGGGITARVVLRPPLAAAIRSVIVNGSAHTNFDGDSVTILQTPAEITCTTF